MKGLYKDYEQCHLDIAEVIDAGLEQDKAHAMYWSIWRGKLLALKMRADSAMAELECPVEQSHDRTAHRLDELSREFISLVPSAVDIQKEIKEYLRVNSIRLDGVHPRYRPIPHGKLLSLSFVITLLLTYVFDRLSSNQSTGED